jgi:MoaA/NifB/PqqE/SkfB family radical SAM enzyme
MNPEIVDIVYKDASITDKMFWNHFSGGEILLQKKTFLEIIRKTRQYFNGDVGISTNGFWASDIIKAKQTVEELINVGVSGIAVSTDFYHKDYIPQEHVENAVEAISKAGLKTHSYVMGARCNNDIVNADMINHECEKLAIKAQGNTQMPLAPTSIRSIGKGSNINIPKKTTTPQGNCTDLSECLGNRGPMNPAMVWVDPYGNVMLCYGIIIGNIYNTPFKDIIDNYDESKFPIVEAISQNGPKELLKLADNKSVITPEAFYDVCDVCYQTRKALINEYAELGPRECYPN